MIKEELSGLTDLEALEVSKQLKDFVLEFIKNGLDRRFINGSFGIIETELKALKIIKEKTVDIDYIRTCFYDEKGGFKEYNAWVGHDEDEELIQEEYDLLKEVLEDGALYR